MNPEKAVDAILAGPVKAGPYTVYPMTMARYAMLEKTGSPLLTGENDTVKLLVSMFVMTQPIEKLMELGIDRVEAEGMKWADSISLGDSVVGQIASAVKQQLEDIVYMSPDGKKDGKKKAPTDG